jgi:hypothetical protein
VLPPPVEVWVGVPPLVPPADCGVAVDGAAETVEVGPLAAAAVVGPLVAENLDETEPALDLLLPKSPLLVPMSASFGSKGPEDICEHTRVSKGRSFHEQVPVAGDACAEKASVIMTPASIMVFVFIVLSSWC